MEKSGLGWIFWTVLGVLVDLGIWGFWGNFLGTAFWGVSGRWGLMADLGVVLVGKRAGN